MRVHGSKTSNSVYRRTPFVTDDDLEVQDESYNSFISEEEQMDVENNEESSAESLSSPDKAQPQEMVTDIPVNSTMARRKEKEKKKKEKKDKVIEGTPKAGSKISKDEFSLKHKSKPKIIIKIFRSFLYIVTAACIFVGGCYVGFNLQNKEAKPSKSDTSSIPDSANSAKVEEPVESTNPTIEVTVTKDDGTKIYDKKQEVNK